MAEEKPITKEIADNEKARQTRSMVMLLMGLSVAVMVLTPIVTIYAFRSMTAPKEEPAAPEVLSTEVALPRLQVNVADPSGNRYAQLEIVIEVSDPAMLNLFSEPDAKNPKGRQKRIMATVINIVSDKTVAGLLSAEGKRQLATEIKDTLNDLLAKDSAGNVLDVYFSGFLVQ